MNSESIEEQVRTWLEVRERGSRYRPVNPSKLMEWESHGLSLIGYVLSAYLKAPDTAGTSRRQDSAESRITTKQQQFLRTLLKQKDCDLCCSPAQATWGKSSAMPSTALELFRDNAHRFTDETLLADVEIAALQQCSDLESKAVEDIRLELSEKKSNQHFDGGVSLQEALLGRLPAHATGPLNAESVLQQIHNNNNERKMLLASLGPLLRSNDRSDLAADSILQLFFQLLKNDLVATQAKALTLDRGINGLDKSSTQRLPQTFTIFGTAAPSGFSASLAASVQELGSFWHAVRARDAGERAFDHTVGPGANFNDHIAWEFTTRYQLWILGLLDAETASLFANRSCARLTSLLVAVVSVGSGSIPREKIVDRLDGFSQTLVSGLGIYMEGSVGGMRQLNEIMKSWAVTQESRAISGSKRKGPRASGSIWDFADGVVQASDTLSTIAHGLVWGCSLEKKARSSLLKMIQHPFDSKSGNVYAAFQFSSKLLGRSEPSISVSKSGSRVLRVPIDGLMVESLIVVMGSPYGYTPRRYDPGMAGAPQIPAFIHYGDLSRDLLKHDSVFDVPFFLSFEEPYHHGMEASVAALTSSHRDYLTDVAEILNAAKQEETSDHVGRKTKKVGVPSGEALLEKIEALVTELLSLREERDGPVPKRATVKRSKLHVPPEAQKMSVVKSGDTVVKRPPKDHVQAAMAPKPTPMRKRVPPKRPAQETIQMLKRFCDQRSGGNRAMNCRIARELFRDYADPGTKVLSRQSFEALMQDFFAFKDASKDVSIQTTFDFFDKNQLDEIEYEAVVKEVVFNN